MKQIACLLILFMLFSGCKCRIVRYPHQIVYRSIKLSKENDAFVCEVQPESSSLKIAGRNYFITEAWVEHPHIEKDFSDELIKQSNALVVNFNGSPHDTIDFHHYVRENANGSYRIWVTIPDEEFAGDILVIHYRETLDSAKKNKRFLFFKKRL